MKLLLGGLLAVLVLALLAIRLAPSDPARWHADPRRAPAGRDGGWVLRAGDGDAPGPEGPLAPEAMLTLFDEIAMQTPRTRRLAGSPEEGRITYITRSAVFGFPDYTTVAAVPRPEGGSGLVLHARLRFGRADMGVNRARVERWAMQLEERMRPAARDGK